MRHHNLEDVIVARLKRMQAIRHKLRRIPHNLSQLQDLGGCRATLLLTLDRIVGLSLFIDGYVRAMRDGQAFTPGYQH